MPHPNDPCPDVTVEREQGPGVLRISTGHDSEASVRAACLLGEGRGGGGRAEQGREEMSLHWLPVTFHAQFQSAAGFDQSSPTCALGPGDLQACWPVPLPTASGPGGDATRSVAAPLLWKGQPSPLRLAWHHAFHLASRKDGVETEWGRRAFMGLCGGCLWIWSS